MSSGTSASGLWVAASFWGLLVSGCTGGSGLFVDVRTDLAPAVEFDEVLVTVDSADAQRIPVSADADFARGVRVAEYDSLARGDRLLHVALRKEDREVLSRDVSVLLRGRLAVRVIITRRCLGIDCPRTGDPENATSCLGGACVDPTCGVETDDGSSLGMCVQDQCVTSADCPATGPCVSPACDQGVCLWLPYADRCASEQYCDPSDGMCRSLPGSDAGVPDAGRSDSGPPDAGPLQAPTGVTANPTDPNDVDVAWTGVPDAESYTVEIAASSDFGSPADTVVSGTATTVSGLVAGTRYYVRVRASAADGRESAWSETVEVVTPLDAPSTPSVMVTIPGAVRSGSAGGWVNPSGAGNWYYAEVQATSNCPTGTTVQYAFQAQYTGTSTVYGWTGWMGPSAYMVQPTTGYGIRFWAKARCVGSAATSGESGVGSACRLASGGSC